MLSFLFGKKSAEIGELKLDVSISEIHEYGSEISEFPIEDGSLITDHIRQAPEKLTMKGFITNTPINIFQNLKTQVVEPIQGFIKSKNFSNTKRSNNVEYAQDLLLSIAGRKIGGENTTPQLVKIVTGLRVYTDMAIENLNFPRDASTGQALRFDAVFKRVKKVDTITVVIPKAKVADKNRASSTVDSGQNTAAKPKAATQRVSKLKRGFYKLAKKG